MSSQVPANPAAVPTGRRRVKALILAVAAIGLFAVGVVTVRTLRAVPVSESCQPVRPVASDLRVRAHLGTPIECKVVFDDPQGKHNHLHKIFQLLGPSGSARVDESAALVTLNDWGPTVFEVAFDDGSTEKIEVAAQRAVAVEQ